MLQKDDGCTLERLDTALIGAGLFILSLVFLTLETAATRYVGPSVPPAQVALLRSVGGVLLVAILARKERAAVFRTGSLRLQITRGMISVVGTVTYYYAFSRLPLVESTALIYTKPIWLTVLAVAVLGENVRLLRWFAVAVAGVGAVIIIDPGRIEVGLPAVAALGSAALSATLITLTKVIERRDRPITVMAYVAGISFSVLIGPGLFSWTPVDGKLCWLVAIMILGPVGQYVGIVAMRSSFASVLAPLEYSRLLFAVVLGYITLNERPTAQIAIGSAGVVVGCFLAAKSARNAVEKKRGDQDELTDTASTKQIGAASERPGISEQEPWYKESRGRVT